MTSTPGGYLPGTVKGSWPDDWAEWPPSDLQRRARPADASAAGGLAVGAFLSANGVASLTGLAPAPPPSAQPGRRSHRDIDRKADAAGRAGESRLVGEADVGEGDAHRDELGMLDDNRIRDSGSRGQATRTSSAAAPTTLHAGSVARSQHPDGEPGEALADHRRRFLGQDGVADHQADNAGGDLGDQRGAQARVDRAHPGAENKRGGAGAAVRES